jgi:type II secretory pathway predicted ATPase ExeA
MNARLLALYGLKWQPFSSERLIEALYIPPRVEQFPWRIAKAQIREGGFAMIHGEPGTGKSVVLRLLASARFDSQPLPCVVLVGDTRLTDHLRREELLPLGSRIRTRLATEHARREELLARHRA